MIVRMNPICVPFTCPSKLHKHINVKKEDTWMKSNQQQSHTFNHRWPQPKLQTSDPLPTGRVDNTQTLVVFVVRFSIPKTQGSVGACEELYTDKSKRSSREHGEVLFSPEDHAVLTVDIYVDFCQSRHESR